MKKLLLYPLLGVLAAGCIVEKSNSAKKADTTTAAPAVTAAIPDSVISVPMGDSISLDTAGLASQMDSLPPLSTDTGFKHITAKSAAATLTKFPAQIPTRGPLPIQLEILLDRAGFSPGIIDGTWGKNAMKAMSWFRVANGMDSVSGSIDQSTYEKLASAGQTSPVITSYQVTADDIKGPFVKIPDNVYQKAKLDCLCYSSPAEALAEKFHTSEQMLKQLNPGVNLQSVTAGTSLQVPNVAESSPANSSGIAKLIISKKGFWTHGVDSSGNVVAHFPSTLGAGYDPSPTGDFHVTGIAHNPAFHYQPALMAEIPDTRPTAMLKPGPNSPVGVVWIALSKPHYGIHGTSSPETIGYVNSHGCVRLTNWDAERLSSMVRSGMPVQFE
jgi:lipoprotein-anchoring transpeptidase ErfK/SrfK